MILTDKKGVSVIVLIVIIVAIGILGAGIIGVMGAKQKSYPYALNSLKALQIANAGVECAIAWVQDSSNANKGLLTSANNLTNISSGGGTFSTVISGTNPNEILTSTGTFNNVSRVVTLSNFRQYAASTGIQGITPDDWAVSQSQAGAITITKDTLDTTNTTYVADLGQIGGTYRFGNLWYGGNNLSGNCQTGKCDFGTGFRAYFVLKYDSSSSADGFTFAIMNGTDNSSTSVGGDSAMGELMAYGGDSRVYSTANFSYGTGRVAGFLDGNGKGLVPPKFAVEFDTYQNGCNDICTGNAGINDNSRCDSNGNDHIAYLFWGDVSNTNTYCKERQYLKWQPSITYPLNSVVFPTTDNSYLYRASVSGTSGGSEPTPWGTTRNWSVTEGPSTPQLAWQQGKRLPSTAYSDGDKVVPIVPNGCYYISDVCGAGTTSSGGDPAWPTALNNTVDEVTTPGDKVLGAGANSSFTYTCILNHKSQNNNRPQSGANWQTYWVKAGSGGAVWQSNKNYIACNYVTWINAGTIAFPGNSPTYDDNRHGAGGTGSNPTNSTAASDYFDNDPPLNSNIIPPNSGNWLIGTPYAFRMEVVRDVSTGSYTIKSWLKKCTTGDDDRCLTLTNGSFGNTSQNYTVDTNAPYLLRTVTLSATDHTKFNKFLFGFTEATGAATQNSKIRNFRLDFR